MFEYSQELAVLSLFENCLLFVLLASFENREIMQLGIFIHLDLGTVPMECVTIRLARHTRRWHPPRTRTCPTRIMSTEQH